jgi:hypothetical protein
MGAAAEDMSEAGSPAGSPVATGELGALHAVVPDDAEDCELAAAVVAVACGAEARAVAGDGSHGASRESCGGDGIVAASAGIPDNCGPAERNGASANAAPAPLVCRNGTRKVHADAADDDEDEALAAAMAASIADTFDDDSAVVEAAPIAYCGRNAAA